MTAPGKIEHDSQNKRFVAVIGGSECVAEYQVMENGGMDLCHTFVAPELRGRGIASRLLTAAAEYARENGLKIYPSCSYAAGFFNRKKEYSDLLGDRD